MKLILVNSSDVKVFNFNEADSKAIIEYCKAKGKQWSAGLLGFFLNMEPFNYMAITVKGGDGVIESMEYIDIEQNKSEFTINENFLNVLAAKDNHSLITLAEFEPLLNEVLQAPTKARRWEVYPEINKYYPVVH